MFSAQADLHTHTLASGHGFGTIREMASAAAAAGLVMLGITEHDAGIPGTCGALYFKNLRVVPRLMCGVRLILGAEINILDYDGRLSMDEKLMRRLDIRIAGIHDYCYAPGDVDQNTAALVAAAKNPLVDIISHPDDGACPVDYPALVRAARDGRTLPELNNNSLNPHNRRRDTFANCVALLKECRRCGQPIVVSSDAHDPSDIGRSDMTSLVLEETRFPDELIVNLTVESMRAWFGDRFDSTEKEDSGL